jgi:CHAD domain-containing protein
MGRTLDIQIGSKGSDSSKEVAAAAAVVGAAALGGKVAWDKRAGSKREAERAFRLYKSEPVPDGIRRIARGQLDQAHDELAGSPKRKLAGAVHDTRKSFKRLRATVRLARDGIGDDTYRRENTAFRDAGRRLSGVRDASVLIETLDELEKASGGDLPIGTAAKLRTQLEAERAQALKSLKADERPTEAVIEDIEQARTRTAAWTFGTQSFEALEPGLRRIYRRGRKAMRRAKAEPTNENLHEWRKRVKDLWHAEQILRPAAPKRMKKLAKRTHALADLLGDDHDLAELRGYAERHRECFDDGVAQVALMAVIDRRRKEFQRQALSLGSKLYARSPRRFVEAIGRAWRKRVGVPEPAAV